MTASVHVKPGSDLRDDFRRAYENRYTWAPGFSGYRGRCIWQQGDQRVEGTFEIGADLKAKVDGIENEEILKAVNSQLWEVAIHRVRRSFEQTHGENTFTAGDTNEVGTEVLVGGKGAGDKYRIKDDVVTMVHRHIHGTVVTIYTTDVTDTGAGYLSHTYTSQYSDPETGAARGGENQFEDSFTPLNGHGPWVLEQRVISSTDSEGEMSKQVFQFVDMEPC